MALPTLQQYNEAAQNPASSFFDAELQQGQVKTSGLGIPLAACGGFALTYTITNGQNKFAVRCFHKEARDRERRYAAISSKLSALKSDYFVGFQFQKNGIKIKGQPYPIVKMSWAKGETIGEFVDANFRKRDSMLALKQSVQNLSSFLERNHISHGDIQPGNLMVSDNGKSVQLIDYDGMYLPELSNLTSEEAGHRNFQHPDRIKINPWNDRTDRFSFILLSIVLEALSHDPQLWIKSKSDGDKFLIGANDFVSPGSSKIFSDMAAIPSLKAGMTRFSSICNGDYNAIPSLGDYLNASFQISVVSAPTGRKVGYISTYPVLDAKDYDLCLQHVGDMVELIGRVEDVRFAYTKYTGKPYYFLNFTDWRGNAVKISIWSEYLEKAKGVDFRKYKGKFISVIGLMQPPFSKTTKSYSYNHLSISLDTAINEIDEEEARYRLNYEKGPIPRPEWEQARQEKKEEKASTSSGRSNRDKFEDFKRDKSTQSGHTSSSSAQSGTGASSSGASSQKSSSSSSSKRRSNRDIFNDIKNEAFSGKTSSSGFTFSQGQSQSRQNTQDFFVPCPVCVARNKTGTSGVETITCSSCGSVFEYSHYTKKSRIKSTTIRQGSSQTQANVWESCPYCYAYNDMGTSGVIKVRCKNCNQEFEYSHYTKKTRKLWGLGNNAASSSQNTGSSDIFEPCPYCQTSINVGNSGINIFTCPNCKGKFTYSHYTKDSTKVSPPPHKPTDQEIIDLINPKKEGKKDNNLTWLWVLAGFLLLLFLLSMNK